MELNLLTSLWNMSKQRPIDRCVSLPQYFEAFENGFAFKEIMTTESEPFRWWWFDIVNNEFYRAITNASFECWINMMTLGTQKKRHNFCTCKFELPNFPGFSENPNYNQNFIENCFVQDWIWIIAIKLVFFQCTTQLCWWCWAVLLNMEYIPHIVSIMHMNSKITLEAGAINAK